jgi:hypothetical protein
MTSRARPIAGPRGPATQQPIGVDGAAGSADELAEILHRPAEETTARMP